MLPSLTLLFVPVLCAAPPDNLDFSSALAGWQGDGFRTTQVGAAAAVSSIGADGKKALLHRTFVVPEGMGTIHFSACSITPDGKPSEHINIFLEAARRRIVSKMVRTAKGFEKSVDLRPADHGRAREYVWSVADRGGQTLRIILLDHAAAPGSHLVCSGFRFEPLDQFEAREFGREMELLAARYRLESMGPGFRTATFLAVGNADADFTKLQLERCELLCEHFLSHFHHKGFPLQRPANRLAVAVFSSQEGLEAYVGHPVPATIAGFYHPATNRLCVYEYGRNRAFRADRERGKQIADTLPADQRQLVLGAMERKVREIRTDANIATIMHEAAHHLSFNTGLLNREGDCPHWLGEGLATYCEATDDGLWKGIGESNPERLRTLLQATEGKLKLLPLRSLLESDQWLRGAGGHDRAPIGYAQSWALFRMLMEEQPRELRRYMELIHPRRTAEHRLADFAEVFGTNFERMEKRHREYIRRMAR